MSKEETISVIIPTYNSARFIADAITSILEQTVKPHEIIVVDDGSADDTESVVRRFDANIQYVYQRNSGIASARNKGVEISKGDLITFIDADDIWCKKKIEIQLGLLQKYSETDVVIGFLQRVNKSSDTGSIKIYEGDESGIFVMQLGSTLIRREVFQKVGMFDEEMAMSEDLDWFLRIREFGSTVHVHKDVVQLYRQHDKNTTRDKIVVNRYMLKAFKKSLDRRKQVGGENFHIPDSFNNMDGILSFWEYNKKK